MMTPYDWLTLGHNIEGGKLPLRRLQIPLAPTAGDLHQLCHDMSGLVLRMSETARRVEEGKIEMRHALHDVEILIRNQNSEWDRKRKLWEAELAKVEQQGSDNVEHLRHQSGT